ncbi:MAG: hypothetical protein SAK29_27065, partial [Scytonema sp. PMC 1069.18]|nr:hypothetical protein [Scytonema sp. PMC 1069.18]
MAWYLDAHIEFIPHLFSNKYLRPLDYLLKLLTTVKHIIKYQPDLLIFQAPPVFAAIPALLMRVPYIIDAHNVAIQGFWSKVPMTKYFMDRAMAVIVHNSEILQNAQQLFPNSYVMSILDPLKIISRPEKRRLQNQILVICSFA